MAVRIQIEQIAVSKAINRAGKLDVSLTVESPTFNFETEATIDASGDLTRDLEKLRLDLVAFATELAQAASQPLQFG
jgi:hypothetical protein